jgi:hypothetical protein
MTFPASAYFLNVPTTPMAPDIPQPLPPITFEGRFERDGKWLLGTHLLGTIVRHIKGKSLVAHRDPSSHTRLNISLPEFPTVRNYIDGSRVDIYWMIPEGLRSIFGKCCFETMAHYRAIDIARVEDEFIGSPTNDYTVAQANDMLLGFERDRQYRNDPRDPKLWQALAGRFGLDWRFLPPRAFVEPFQKAQP